MSTLKGHCGGWGGHLDEKGVSREEQCPCRVSAEGMAQKYFIAKVSSEEFSL